MATIAGSVKALFAVLLAVLAIACTTLPAEPRPQEVAPGVYMVPGAPGEAGAANLGRLGNSGFIVGDTGVIAIDTGVSYRHGQALLAAIARVTDRPVRLALITHTRQEFLFGAAAFQECGIPVHMHRRAAQLMAARCDTCLKTLQRTLGADTMRGDALAALPSSKRSVRTNSASSMRRFQLVIEVGLVVVTSATVSR